MRPDPRSGAAIGHREVFDFRRTTPSDSWPYLPLDRVGQLLAAKRIAEELAAIERGGPDRRLPSLAALGDA